MSADFRFMLQIKAKNTIKITNLHDLAATIQDLQQTIHDLQQTI